MASRGLSTQLIHYHINDGVQPPNCEEIGRLQRRVEWHDARR
jgi:hypothetical protein